MDTDVVTPARVLIVDDSPASRTVLARMLEMDGYCVETAECGEQALAAVAAEAPDVILLDVVMADLDGYEVCRRLKGNPASRLIPVVLVTTLEGRENRLRGLEAGADDFLSKPVDRSELRVRVRSLVGLKRHTDELESAESVILSLALTIEARDSYTEGHCERLAALATGTGARLGLGKADLEVLARGGFLHDIGKIGVPDAILLKPGPLTVEELVLMQRHPVIGERLCAGLRSLRPVQAIIRHHHERYDGGGYPDGLHGDAIPLFAQIMHAADVFDALQSPRPYKPAYSVNAALRELRREVGRGWHRPDVVEALMDVVRAMQVGTPLAPRVRALAELESV